jgi:ABC-type uncharacterized transport system auxiliary subunit
MKKYYLFVLVISVLLIQSCSTKVITRNYYILEFPVQDEKIQTGQSLVNASCEIFAVNIPEAFSQSRIAIRKRSHEINYYQNHLWAVPPGDLIAQLIETHIQKENIFTNASQTIWKDVPVYRIHSSVFQLEAMDIDDDLFAHLKMRIDLFNRTENQIIVSYQFDRREILEERDINLLAELLSRILQEELQVFSNKIKTELTK